MAVAAATTVCLADLAAVSAYIASVNRLTATAVSDSARYDAAVVFFGSREASGQLGAGTILRLADAAALFRSGRVQEVIAVGGARREWPVPGSRIMADSLRSLGVPAANLAYDSTSYDSFSNVESARAFGRSRDFHSFLLVSSPTHLWRLKRIVGDSRDRVGFFARTPAAGDESRLARWRTAHRELFVFVAMTLLPRSWYVGIVRRLRGARGPVSS